MATLDLRIASVKNHPYYVISLIHILYSFGFHWNAINAENEMFYGTKDIWHPCDYTSEEGWIIELYLLDNTHFIYGKRRISAITDYSKLLDLV